jgi:flagellar basal body-associated protein FliL
MPTETSSKRNSIIIGVVVVVALLLGGGYYWYNSSSENGGSSAGVVDISLFTKKEFIEFYKVKDKAKFGDMSFTKKDLYNQLEEHTVNFPTTTPPGRDDPYFPPYATP